MVSTEGHVHETNVYMVQPAPTQAYARAGVGLEVGVSCPESCDLRGSMVRIIAEDAAVLIEVELAEFDGTVSQTGEFQVQAPTDPGEYMWTAVFPAQEKEGILHEQSSTPLSFIVKPHSTSIAVWDVPSPVAFGDKFRIKVGVKCSAECELKDKEVDVFDHGGRKVASGALGGAPWSDTRALYWREVGLEAPGEEGHYVWRVEFPKPDLDLPHEEASYSFSFTTGRPPEYLVTVEVTGQDTKAPLRRAHVLLRPESGFPYRGFTDESGVAKVEVPKDKYALLVSKGKDYDTFRTTVDANGNVTVKAELVAVHDPYG